ncbi:uncharacterized protein LOC126839366 [Adelges cooleyi]|uniref:uncharacterized protein LOC126839366 n=1 Tax=Adelges cooleyi TaxID=133065 RepID=UPI00217F3911|nr:uncharacterized protein LOC126839366 [Adelges cooleyi]
MILEASNRQLVNILANIDSVLVNMKNYNKKSRQKYLVEKSNVETYEKTFNEGLAMIKQKKNTINQLSKIIPDYSPRDEEKQKSSAEQTESKKTSVTISEPLPAAVWRNQES